jgi:lipopolysaccharide transport system ATP-binding protein
MPVAIKAENISKAYRLGEIGTGTLQTDLKRWYALTRGKEDPFLKIGETNDRSVKGVSNVVWSLKDISFEIEQGDAVGIVGKNGAGKSTLLKILSRVTSPTTGKISGNGRVASLLEVGTGFHPELTGRENIYINGAILGMRKKEITRKFDEIVDFAGVERYIDTPVKRYSSGMYVRLAFAVAAHLESEILIVDEVLAVGDAEFQKKCLGKMNEVSKGEGRTVLFVSHNMGAVSQLCNKAMLLHNGRLILNGFTEEIITEYINNNAQNNNKTYSFEDSSDKLTYYIKSMEMLDKQNNLRDQYGTNEEIKVKLSVALKESNPSLEIALALFDKRENRVFTIHRKLFGKSNFRPSIIEILLPERFLAPGFYKWVATLHIPNQISFHLIENVCGFRILDTGTELYNYEGTDIGVVLPNYSINFY